MKNLSHWLRKAPQPVALLADGQRIEVPKNARAWRDLLATIDSLEPSKLTALDGQGNVLRSIVIESDEAQPSAASEDMTTLQLFAKLIAEGYQHGMKANQPLVDSAMGFVEKQAQASQKKDVEIERLRALIHKQNLQIIELTGAPSADGGDDSILGTMLAAVAQAGAAGAGPLANLSTIKPAVKK